MKTEKRKEFEQLLALIGVRALNDQELSQLNNLMKEEAGWAEEYYEHCHIHGMLHEKNNDLMSYAQMDKFISKSQASDKAAKKFPTWILAVAACLIFAFILKFNQKPEPTFVAQLKTGINHQLLDNNGQSVRIGDRLKGSYSLEKGLAEFVYGEGVKVIVEGPAQIELIDADTMALKQGKVYALTPPGAKGFTITTPKAVFNDLGTEFAVEYFDKKDATLEVYQGKVQAVTNAGLEKILTAGQAIRLKHSGKILNAAVRKDYFVRELPSLEHSYQQLAISHNPVVYLPLDYKEQQAFYNYSVFSPGKVNGQKQAAVNGTINQAYRINQENYLSVTAYPKASDFITVMTWIKIEPGASGIIARNGNGKGQFNLYLENGYLKTILRNRHGIPVITSLSTPLEAGKWHHIALTYDGGKIILYHNSKLAAAKTNNEGIYTENLVPYMTLGSGSSETLSFTGELDEFSIFNKALSRADIKSIFNSHTP